MEQAVALCGRDGKMEVLFQILFEVVGQILLELSIDVLGKSNKSVERMAASSFLLALLAVFVAAATLFWLPNHLIRNPNLRLCSLLLTPVLNGLLMAAIGRYLILKGKRSGHMEHFVPAFTFAFIVSVCRFFWAH